MDNQQKHANFVQMYLKAVSEQNWQNILTSSTEIIKLGDDKLHHVWQNRGLSLQQLDCPVDALLNYEKSLEFEDSAVTHSNMGACYYDSFRFDEAEKHLKRAKEIEKLPQTYLTHGNVKRYRGDDRAALAEYEEAVKLDPEYADGHLVLAMMLLKLGEFKRGWQHYEWRWKTNQLPARKLKCPLWKGEDLSDKYILVYGEQGLGDIIQFARYVRVLSNRFPRAKIIIEGRHEVRRLLESIPEAYAVINCGDKLPHLDYGVPMLTLAGMMTPSQSLIPTLEREFFIDSDKIQFWRDKFDEIPELAPHLTIPKGLRVGFCWAGMARDLVPAAQAIDRIRSMHIDDFAPIIRAFPDLLWVSLQKGPPGAQLKELKVPGAVTVDMTEHMYDFYETCAAIENCDLVISVDTAVVHAAASMGKPTWLISRWDGCWRWFGNREDSPWYPSLRQFTQPKPGDWPGVVAKVIKALGELVADKKQGELDLTLE